MSIATEIQRLQTAKANIKTAIEQKGVTVGDGLIDTYAELISQIDNNGNLKTPKNVDIRIISPEFDIALNTLQLEHKLSVVPQFVYIVNLDIQKVIENFDSVDQITLSVSANRTLQENTTKNGTGSRFWFSKSRGTAYDYIDYTNNVNCEMTDSYVCFTNGVLHGGYSYMIVIVSCADEATDGDIYDYDQGYEDGKNSVVQIDRLVKNCSFPSLNVFGKSEVELNFDNMTGFTNLFQITDKVYANTTVEHLTINCPNYIGSIQQILYCHSTASDYTLKKVTLNFDTQKCTNFGNAFTCQRALEVIDGQPLNYSAVTNANYMNGFLNCGALVEVRIVPNTIKLSISFANCGNLSTETIQSIIDGLADLTGGTAQTLTLHATVGAKLTDEQKATITAKNWTLVY